MEQKSLLSYGSLAKSGRIDKGVHWTQPWARGAWLGPAGPAWDGRPRPQTETEVTHD